MNTALLWGLVAIGLATFLVPLLASLATSKADAQWYHSLKRPHWAPADRSTGRIWAGLYALAAVAAGVAWWTAGGDWDRAGGAMLFYVLQLALSGVWSYIFFAQRRLGAAAAATAALALCVYAATTAFFGLGTIAGLLMVPYLCWVLVATIMSAVMWEMNTEPPTEPEPAAVATGLAFQVGSVSFTPAQVRYKLVTGVRSALRAAR